MLSFDRILISNLVVTNLLMCSPPGMILLYLAARFLHWRWFWMRLCILVDSYRILLKVKENMWVDQHLRIIMWNCPIWNKWCHPVTSPLNLVKLNCKRQAFVVPDDDTTLGQSYCWRKRWWLQSELIHCLQRCGKQNVIGQVKVSMHNDLIRFLGIMTEIVKVFEGLCIRI